MAFVDPNTVWEIRTTGLSTNGGGFANVTPGFSVDYSQQDAAQLSLNDITTDGAGTMLTSATGGFTHAMEGNVLYLRGGTVTEGFYQIISGGYMDGNNIIVHQSAGSNKGGGFADVGGAFKFGGNSFRELLIQQVMNSCNLVWFGPGTHGPLLGSLIFQASAGPRVGRWVGYHAVRGDNPVGDDRPLIDVAHWGALFTNFHSQEHLRFTGTSASVVSGTGLARFFNCKAINTNPAVTHHAFSFAGTVAVFAIACEGVTQGGVGSTAFLLGEKCIAVHCFGRDSPIGFSGAPGTVCSFCVADSCDVGYQNVIFRQNCLAYNCTHSYESLGTPPWDLAINDISDLAAVDFYNDQAEDQQGVFTLYNCLHGVTHFTHILDWYGNIIGDPGLKNPGAHDYRVDSFDKNVFEKAVELSQFTGAKV